MAENLWNGFDEDFQEAVQKYFSEKWNMPKKEDVVSEIIEKAVPVPDNSAQDFSDVPVYYEPFSYAKENDEVDVYRTSNRLNSECKQAIQEAIADNYDGMYLGDDAVGVAVDQSGPFLLFLHELPHGQFCTCEVQPFLTQSQPPLCAKVKFFGHQDRCCMVHHHRFLHCNGLAGVVVRAAQIIAI